MVKKQVSIQEKTSADSKAIGFDYQYYYFLYHMLQLKNEESIGYEVKDDVHIDKSNGKQILIQLKHSIETRADGSIINLAEKDEDLWKTISNWKDLINDPFEKRMTLEVQIEYIKKTDFQLVTNKSNSTSNKFISSLQSFQENKLNIKELRSYLTELSTPKKNKNPSSVDNYIIEIIKQDDEWLKEFFSRLFIEHNKDDLISRIKMKIKEKNIDDNRIDDVFAAVDSHLRRMIYDDVKARKKVTITFDDYHKRFTRFFKLGQSIKLPIRLSAKKVELPQYPENYISIKQLIDIEDLHQTDEDYEEKLINIFASKMEMQDHLTRWIQKDEITLEIIKGFNETTKKLWQNIFNGTYIELKRKLRGGTISDISDEEIIGLALKCYYEVLKKELIIDETPLDITMSNGQFYLLSEIPVIGWHYRWKERYKLNE